MTDAESPHGWSASAAVPMPPLLENDDDGGTTLLAVLTRFGGWGPGGGRLPDQPEQSLLF